MDLIILSLIIFFCSSVICRSSLTLWFIFNLNISSSEVSTSKFMPSKTFSGYKINWKWLSQRYVTTTSVVIVFYQLFFSYDFNSKEFNTQLLGSMEII